MDVEFIRIDAKIAILLESDDNHYGAKSRQQLCWRTATSTFIAASSSLFSLASARSFASHRSFAVGMLSNLRFSSASYCMSLSCGDACERTVEGIRYVAAISICIVLLYVLRSTHNQKPDMSVRQCLFDSLTFSIRKYEL